MANETITLIPNKFYLHEEMPDGSMKEITVKIGEETSDEIMKPGHSATQKSKVYRVNLDPYAVHIIDTPGVGDTKTNFGDKKHIENIMATISRFDEIHGIVILFKTNESRLTVWFQYCINELLKQLHRSAMNNIVFGFTYSRTTMYRPGETYKLLQSHLSEIRGGSISLSKHTVYCFDSESYRFMAARSQGMQFEEEVKKEFDKSWQHSVKETKRMFEHIASLQPHRVRNTTNLNSVRNKILNMTEPMAEIRRNIQYNMNACNRYVEDLRTTKARGAELEKKLKVQHSELFTRPISSPKTVCANKSCTRTTTIDGIGQLEYHTVCHEDCQLTEVVTRLLGHPELANCWAILRNVCRKCGHSWEEHMHIRVEYYREMVTREDEGVKSQLRANMTDAEKITQAISKEEHEQNELTEELKIIEKAAALFGCFLERNAILPYNDVTGKCFDFLIEQEEQVASRTGNKKLLESLKEGKARYEVECKIILESMKNNSESVSLDPAVIDREVDKLFQLKHSGPSLKRVFDRVGEAKEFSYKEVTFPTPRIIKGRKPVKEKGGGYWWKIW